MGDHSKPSLNNGTLHDEVSLESESLGLDNNICSSAKMSRTTISQEDTNPNGSLSVTYTWDQSHTDLTVLLKFNGLQGKLKGQVDVSFTCSEVHISISNKERHSIHFYKPIEKEQSRVQISNDVVKLTAIKQEKTLWPTLESESKEPTKELKMTTAREEKDDLNKSLKIDMGSDNQGDTGTEIVDKEEEPVYHLNHLKNSYFERDLQLILQVFVSMDKDSVKIVFSKQGFVLKFHTIDEKFLQLHEGTSSETTFSWSVTTSQEIVAEDCKYKVKPTCIEVTLKKTSTTRWRSLEAPLRKEVAEPSKKDLWVPLKGAAVQPSLDLNSTSKPESTSMKATETPKPKVMFDELDDIDLNRGRAGLYPKSTEIEIDPEQISTAFGSNLKPRPSTSSHDWNKPTAKVQPLSQGGESNNVINPGFAGLVNIGNTCFMNCVIQVLVNTREFRDYFLDDRFLAEINEDNPLGMKGHLATTFGSLLKRLWSRSKYCWEPRRLKELISRKNPQFFGFAQHDAHEFLAFLLDGLHEDLNRIKKKPYVETTDSNGRPDEVVAAEAWVQYKSRNDSAVVDLFQGQYKSKLVCPLCGKVSITFDPFLYLSLPLPKKKRVIPVIFMWKEFYKKPAKFDITVSEDSSVEKLIEELSNVTNVQKKDIRVFEAYRGKIHKFFPRGSSLNNVESKDIIIASEILSREQAGEEVLEIPVMQRTTQPWDTPRRCASCHKPCMDGCRLSRCTKCLKVGYCDKNCQRLHWSQHKSYCNKAYDAIGYPFLVSVGASRATYSNLVRQMEGFARYSVDVFVPPEQVSSDIVSSSSNQTSLNNVSNQTSVNSGLKATNLSSSLSQSSSSLNSLDSLSSASSTCTLTGEQSDPPCQTDGDDNEVTSTTSNSGTSSMATDLADSARCPSIDSGFESNSSRSERSVPVSQVMGVQMSEKETGKLPRFYIKPVSQEGIGLTNADRLQDEGDKPLNLVNCNFLSMDWRNNEKMPSYVCVDQKEFFDCEEIQFSNQSSSTSSNKPSLYECLELFTEPEVLSPEEAWYCPKCKKHVEASKQMSIWRLPHTLIIQLKRFSFQKHNLLMRSKIKKHIEFPTRGLDMKEFCVSQDESPPIYDLYGVANHHGMLIGGHYTSYARCHCDKSVGGNDVGWRLCDDSRVSSTTEDSVVTSDAYLLFYRRRGCKGSISGPKTNLAAPSSQEEILPRKSKSSPVITNPAPSLDQKLSSYSKSDPTESDKRDLNNDLFDNKRFCEKSEDVSNGGTSNCESQVERGEVELMEKQSESTDKTVSQHLDLNKECEMSEIVDLGYTDMEAVD